MYETIGLGGGCHWCTEAVFQSLKGIKQVQQGWIASTSPHDSFSEAVLVEFDQAIIKLADLIHIHLYTHNGTSVHSMRDKYRSAIYFNPQNKRQQKLCADILHQLQVKFNAPIITQVLPARSKRRRKNIRTIIKKHRSDRFANNLLCRNCRLWRNNFLPLSSHNRQTLQVDLKTNTVKASDDELPLVRPAHFYPRLQGGLKTWPRPMIQLN